MDTETAISCTVAPLNKKDMMKIQAHKSRSTIGTKRRKNRSEVWDYFDKLEEGTYTPPRDDDYKRGRCKGCNALLVCDSRYGTTNLRRHIKACLKLELQNASKLDRQHGLKLERQNDVKQLVLDDSISDDVPSRSPEIDNSVYRGLLVKMIVRHDLPLSLVELAGVKDVHTHLNPGMKHISTSSCQVGMIKLYQKGKKRVKELLRLCTSRISLSSSIWGSATGDSYMCITAHFIGEDWKGQNFVLCFLSLPPPQDGPLISETLSKLLGEGGWNIEHKLMAITSDNATNNITFVDSYMTKLLSQGALLSSGRFFKVSCAANVINSIVKDGLDELHDVIQKVRNSLKYVKGSPSRLVKFKEAARDKMIHCVKKLRHDAVASWISTYLMLESALFYQSAFSHLAIIDKCYPYCPSPDEWKKVEALCKLFKPCYEFATLFSGSGNHTSNVLFHRLWPIQHQLLEDAKNPESFMSAMLIKMQRKFDNYWEESNLILSAAVVLDPRYKMKVVEYVNTEIYGKVEGFLKARIVRDLLVILFAEYKEKCSSVLGLPQPLQLTHEVSNTPMNTSDIYPNDLNTYGMDGSSVEEISELDLYLHEPLMDRKGDLDVLGWWKSVHLRFPCLAKLARDVLSIPISSVDSKSAFNIGGRMLKHSRCSLSHKSIEALICTRNWIYGLKEEDQEHLDSLTEAMLSLDLNASTSQADANEVIDAV